MSKLSSSVCSGGSELSIRFRPLQKIYRTYEVAMSSLRWRLLWLSMLPLILFALIWMSYVLAQRYSDLSSQLEQRAQLLARQMAVAADYAIFAQNTLVLQNITSSVANEPEVSAAGVYDAGFMPLSVSASKTVHEASGQPAGALQLQAVARAGKPSMQRVSDRLIRYVQPIASVGVDVEDLATPAGDAQSAVTRGYAVVEVSLGSLYTELVKFLGGALLMLVSFLLTAWLVVSRFSSKLDQSFRSVADAAKRIGAGETQVRIEPNDIKVFDRLARDLNLMAARLEFSQRDMEQRVLAATFALREQKDAAEKANSAKSRFLAAASHDLRQPMHALSLLVSAAQREKDPVAQSAIIRRIETGTSSLSDLLNSLLDISRLDGGGVRVHKEDFALEALMHKLEDTYQSLAEEKGLVLTVRPTKAWTHSDPALLERVLGNLLSNAIRYTPRGGAVYVAVRPRGAEWLVQIRDSGPGIPVKDQETIFQEFVQLSNPQRDRSLGLGLGLAIVQRLVHLLGHRVEVRSQLGRGATFGLRVPCIHSNGSNALVTDAGKANEPTELNGLRILVIEDDELVRESFAGLLGMWGASVDVFAQADTAFEFIKAHAVTPELIITDHRLGGDQNGLELSRAIASHRGSPVPTLLITGDTEDEVLQRLSEPHVLVLYKPVKPNVLMATISRLLSPVPAR
jgi:signal transduction histidine kinase